MSKLKVKVKPYGEGEVRLAMPFHDDLVEWARGLPERRWFNGEIIEGLFGDTGERKGAGWIVPTTPAVCSALVRTCPVEIEAPDYIHKLAAQFVTDIKFGNFDLSGEGLEQPAKRVFDQWGHQLASYHFAVQRDFCAMLAMGMGTGKSKVTIDIAVNEDTRTNLILAPPSVLSVWRREVKRHAPQAEALILDDSYSSVKKKRESAERFIDAAKYAKVPFFVVVNYESARMAVMKEFLLSQAWDLTGLDESHRAKAPDGVTGELVGKLRTRSRRRLCLTGTPMAHSPADLYSQFRFVDLTIFGDSYYRFKRKYAVEGYFKEILGWKKKDEMQAAFHSAAIVVPESVLDLPDTIHIEREFKLPNRTAAIYAELWNEMIVATDAGVCTADNVLVKMIRAAQITSGFLSLDDDFDPLSDDAGDADRDEIEVLHNAKEKLLFETLRDNQEAGPVVVFCRFRYDLDAVHRVALKIQKERKAGDPEALYRCGEISGRRKGEPTPSGPHSGKKDLTPNAELADGFEIFAVQVQSGGVGVDFTKSAVAVLYSIDFSLGNYEQMLKRLDRPGQERHVRYIHFVAKGTVDRVIYQRLAARKEVISEIVDAVNSGDLDALLNEDE